MQVCTWAMVHMELPSTPFDKSDKAFDKLTLAADFGDTLEAGTVLYEATAVSGTTPKVIANSALYERVQVEEGIVLVAL